MGSLISVFENPIYDSVVDADEYILFSRNGENVATYNKRNVGKSTGAWADCYTYYARQRRLEGPQFHSKQAEQRGNGPADINDEFTKMTPVSKSQYNKNDRSPEACRWRLARKNQTSESIPPCPSWVLVPM